MWAIFVGWLACQTFAFSQGPPDTSVDPAPTGQIEWQPNKLDPPFSGTVMGQIVGPQSKAPVAGVTVHLLHPLVITQPNKRFAVITDDQGRFRFDKLPIGRNYAIYATHRNSATFADPNRIQMAKLDEDGEVLNIQLELKSLKTMSFQILDRETKAPLPGALVNIRRFLLQPLAHELIPFLPVPEISDIGRTDENGIFETGFLAGEFHLSLSRKEYREQVHRMSLQGTPEKAIVLEMDRGGELYGKVRDSNGKPIPKAWVTFGFMKVAMADEKGSYRVTGLNLDMPQNVRFQSAGFLPKVIQNVSFPMFAKKKRLDVSLERGGPPVTSPFAGRKGQKTASSPWPPDMKIQLLDSENHPVRNAPVRYENNWKVFDGTTDEKGQLVLNLNSPHKNYWNDEASLDLKVFVESHGVGKHLVKSKEFQSGKKVVALVLPPKKTLRGQLVDALGKPVAGARIHTQFKDGASWHFWRESPFTTDSEGRFVLDHVGDDLHLQIRADGFQFQKVDLKDLPEQEKVFTLIRPMRFLGQVKDIDGIPIEKFKVNVLGKTDVFMEALKMPIQVFDPEGKFEVRHLEVNEPFRLFISAPGFMGKAFGPFIPEQYDAVKRRELVLDNTSTTLKGQVVDAGGLGIAGVKIWAGFFDKRGQWISKNFEDPKELRTKGLVKLETVTDDHGDFFLDGVPENLDWALYFYKDSFNVGYLDNGMSSGLENGLLKVILMRPAKIEVHAEGDPYRNAYQLEVFSFGGNWETLPLNGKEPPWIFDKLKPGDYSVKVYGPPPHRYEQPVMLAEKKVVVGEAESARVTFQAMKDTLRLAGVAYSGETVLSNADVWLFQGKKDTEGRKVTTDLQGHFEFENLPPQEYRLYYFGIPGMKRELVGDFRRREKAVTVVLDKNLLNLKAVFPATIHVRGTIKHRQRRVRLHLESVSTNWRRKLFRSFLDRKGNFSLDVDEGNYDVKYYDSRAFRYHLFQEDLRVSADHNESDLGILEFDRKTGLVVRVFGLPPAFEIPDARFDIYKMDKSYFRNMKPIFQVNRGIKDGMIFTGLAPGTYSLQIDNRKNEGIFEMSWDEMKVEVSEGEIKEVNLGAEMFRGCMVVLDEPGQALDSVIFLDPQSQSPIHTSSFDGFDLENRARFANVEPGTWILQANSKEGKTWTRTVTIPNYGGLTVRLGEE